MLYTRSILTSTPHLQHHSFTFFLSSHSSFNHHSFIHSFILSLPLTSSWLYLNKSFNPSTPDLFPASTSPQTDLGCPPTIVPSLHYHYHELPPIFT